MILVRVEKWLRLAVVILACLVLGSWILVTVARIDDSFGTDGPWTGLSLYAAGGTYYPPLFDGQHFGGTRYMPLQFVLYAAVSKVTGEYFVSAKMVIALIAAGTLIVVYATLRRLRCTPLVALGVTSATLVTAPVLLASTAVRTDSLALLLQLAAVAAVARNLSQRSAGIAGVLSALAFLAKLSAVWAPVAILVCLAARRRATVPVFLASYAATIAVGVIAVVVASDGRLLDNLSLVSTGGRPGVHALAIDLPRKFATLMMDYAGGVWLLTPLAVLAFLFALEQKKFTVHQVSALAAVLVTAAVLTDEGAHWNHLLDVTVLLAIVAAELDASLSSRETSLRPVHLVLLAALSIGMGTGYLIHIGPHLGGSLRGIQFGVADQRFPSPPLASYIRREEAILSEDASISVARGQRPVVLDPFMLLRILDDRPEWEEALVRRIDAHEFDKVVLLRPLVPTGHWYTKVHLGRPVALAIERNYRLDAQADGYSIYVPRGEDRTGVGRTRR